MSVSLESPSPLDICRSADERLIVRISTARERHRNASRTSGRSDCDGSSSYASASPTQTQTSGSRSESTPRLVNPPASDYELLERARLVYSTIDFEELNNNHQGGKWNWVSSSNRISVFTRTLQHNVPEVLCHGRIENASLQELAGILHSSTDREHSNNMTALYGKAFIFGSVDHAVHAGQPSASASTQSTSGESVTIKTSTYVHSERFGRRNEQWCFLERFARKPERDGFTVSMSSLKTDEATPGRLDSTRVDQLHGLTVACLVEAVPASRRGASYNSNNNQNSNNAAPSPSSSVRVLFYAWFNGSSTIGSRDLASSAKLARARLLLLAKGLSRLPELVRRRRFGMQKLADLSAFRVKNPRCTCCTKKFRFSLLAASKKRCYLCGYFVCDDCWSLEQMETYNGHLVGIVICTRCSFCVDACDYSKVGTAAKDRAPVRVRADRSSSSSNSNSSSHSMSRSMSKSNGKGSVESSPDTKSQQLVGYLETLLVGRGSSDGGSSGGSLSASNSPSKQQQVVSVIRAMMEDDDEDSNAAGAKSVSPVPKSLVANRMMLHELGAHMASARVPIDQCTLAGGDNTRPYPLDMPAEPQGLLGSPIPDDESKRLQLIEKLGLHNITDVPELELICELAALEMKCPNGLVSLVVGNSQQVLASNVEALKRVEFPRNQTCCQHAVMTERPLVLQHLETDVRFQSMPSVKEMGVDFYCGFPLRTPCDTIVGTLCCFDQEPHDISQSQYTAMGELSRAATRILVAEAKRRQKQLQQEQQQQQQQQEREAGVKWEPPARLG